MKDVEIARLVAEIVRVQEMLQRVCGDDDPQDVAVPQPPATEKQIARLAEHMDGRGQSLPPSFAQFLRIHNGVRDFVPSLGLSIRSAEQIVSAHDSDARWGLPFPAHEYRFAEIEQNPARAADPRWQHQFPAYPFIFGSDGFGSDDPDIGSALAGFMPGSADQHGEMAVLMVHELRDAVEYDNFVEFLEDELAYRRGVLDAYSRVRSTVPGTP